MERNRPNQTIFRSTEVIVECLSLAFCNRIPHAFPSNTRKNDGRLSKAEILWLMFDSPYFEDAHG